MEYTYLPIENTTLIELRTDKFISMLDTTIPIYNKMITEFQDPLNIGVYNFTRGAKTIIWLS
jgi:hypothetical protein